MKNIVVLDSFYQNPDKVRELAIKSEWIEKSDLPQNFPGSETKISFFNEQIVSKIESAIGKKIDVNPKENSFGVFAKASKQDSGKNVIHTDHTEWAGIVYLSKKELGGTNFYKHKETGLTEIPSDEVLEKMEYKNRQEYRNLKVVPDQSSDDAWELNAKIGMKFNRFVIFRAGTLFHSADSYYGESEDTERLIQLFFFNTKE